MSIVHRKAAVARTAGHVADLEVARPALGYTPRGVAGAMAGTAVGVAFGAGAAGLVPSVGASVFMALGLLFGAFNGALFALISHPHHAN